MTIPRSAGAETLSEDRPLDWSLISSLLERAYGNPRHGNPQDPTDCLFYLMLTRKTSIARARLMYSRIRLRLPQWKCLIDLSEEQLRHLLAGGGLEGTKARSMKKVAAVLLERFGAVTLDGLRSLPDQKCLEFLLKLPGVGLKTALCVMMYSLGRDMFPADAHCVRVLQRMGAIPVGIGHRTAQKLLMRLVPPNSAYKLHVNLIAHGQSVCKPRNPLCQTCVVRVSCAPSETLQFVAESGIRPSPGTL